MVPIPQISLTHAPAAINRDHRTTASVFFTQWRPLITYGKRDARPLPLTANQFKRHDPYSIPLDEDEDADKLAESTEPLIQTEPGTPLGVAENSDSKSGLSDDPTCEAAGKLVRSKGSVQQRSAIAAQTVVLPGNRTRVSASQAVANSRLSSAYAEDHVHARKRVRLSPKDRAAVWSAGNTARRLPVNELVLVESPGESPAFDPPQSSLKSIQIQDPIKDQTSSPGERDGSCTYSESYLNNEQAPTKQPLSAFKKRLRSNKSRYKSISDLRKKPAGRLSLSSLQSHANGDGFNEQELIISPLARKSIRKRHSRHDPLISGFGVLKLQSGPLPDVKFEPASLFKVEDKTASPHDEDAAQTPQHSSRRVSFIDRARKDAIIAQLSSISAPRVPRAESDDSDEDANDNCDDLVENEGSCEIADEDQIAEGFQAVAEEDDDYEADTEIGEDLETPPRENATDMATGAENPELSIREEPAVNQGVSLDFRSHVPGQLRRRRIRQDGLMEVNENIL